MGFKIMKFVVNDIAATPNAGGVYSILEDFYNDVLENDHTNQWVFILAGKYFEESDNVRIIVRKDLKTSKIKKLIFERFTGRKFINLLKPDVYISLQNIATYGIKTKKQIVYLHQPIPFETTKSFSFFNKREAKLAVYQKLIGKFIKKSLSDNQPMTIVQTKWMKRSVVEQTTLEPNYIIISHPKVNIDSNRNVYKGKGNLFFYPASNFLYKNQEVIYKAVKLLEKKGLNDFKVVFTLDKASLPYEDRSIKYVGHISREKVMDMYNDHILIFPSYIESFGLPLIEAALHADIILAADTPFAHELLDQYTNVYYFQYDSQIQLAKLMKKAIDNELFSNDKALELKNNGENLLTVIDKLVNR